MTFRYKRIYRGPVQAVVFDWAGTVVDFGCQAPVSVFIEVFQRSGVTISVAEARIPMGMNKRDHIGALMKMPSVRERWESVHGRLPTETDIDLMYEEFIPLQIECIRRHADVIPGSDETLASLRDRGIKIGSNTGYSRQMMEVLAPIAKEAGFDPDVLVCSDDLGIGRPTPWMALEAARRMGTYPVESVVKVDDTISGIEEGLNAGMWTVAVAASGNELGLTLCEVKALPEEEYLAQLNGAYHRLASCGAHFVVDSIADLIPCIECIQRRLHQGEKP